MSDDLRKLLERVESATGPNFQLEVEISGAIDSGGLRLPPNYTSSIDAAVGLCERVLPGWTYILENHPVRKESNATVWNPDSDTEILDVEAKTPALALCAAILRARIEQLEMETRDE